MVLIARLLACASLMLASPLAAAEPQPPAFSAFPAAAPHVLHRATVHLVTPADRQFRTQLREGAAEPVNFAGHYRLALWGCGASCQMGAAIDSVTGRVTWLPFTVSAAPVDAEPLTFRRDSRLLIVRGSRNEAGGGTYYYTFGDDGFVLLRADETQ